MGVLLARCSSQRALLEAWADTRSRLSADGLERPEVLAFEGVAARTLAEVSDALRDGRWRPHPVARVAIPKPGGGLRTLGIPSLEDRIVERAVLRVIDPVVDPELLPWSFGYRRGVGVADAIRALVDERDEGARFVVRGDLTRCFDAIPRRRLLARFGDVVVDRELTELVRRLVNRPVAGKRPPDHHYWKGLHQGAPLSPILANLYLDAFDRLVLDATGAPVIRFADDFAVAVTSLAEAQLAMTATREAALSLGLDLSAEKLRVDTFEQGVSFLGQVVTAGTGSRTDRLANPLAVTVYVTHQGALLRSKGDRLRAERIEDDKPFSISFNRLRQVVVFGRVGLTTPLMQKLLARGIDLVMLSERGQYYGRLQGAAASNPFLRDAQYAAAREPSSALDIARRIVAGKIVNMRAALLRGRRRGRSDELVDLLAFLSRSRAAALKAESLGTLLGVEGSASREYFRGLSLILTDDLVFPGRRRRPPPDPVNSLLSFCYSLLIQDVIGAVEASGLDPAMGFLHRPRVGRPSLALDLVEELRPVVVDSVVLRLFNTRALTANHFTTDIGPPQTCLLTAEGRSAAVAAYERRMLTLYTHVSSGRRVSYRVGAGLQARVLAEELLGLPRRYEPVVWK